MSKKKAEKPDEVILFPEVDVAGIIIKPWSFGKLFDISLLLDRVIEKAQAKGLVDKLETDSFSQVDVARLFTLASSELLEIISITVNEPIEKIKDLSIEDGIKIILVIFSQNKEKIKNALSPLLSQEIHEEGEE